MCVIDRYSYCLLSLCRSCQNKRNTPMHSCSQYPKKDGIPPEIWRGERKECSGYVKKNHESTLAEK